MVAIVLGIGAAIYWVASGRLTDDKSAAALAPADPNAVAPAPMLAGAKGIDFEKYERPDPTLPAPPPGAVKKFKVDVYEHVTHAINGKDHRGTGVSEPMVVTQGDRVEIELSRSGT